MGTPVHNFNAGPAALPKPVLEQVQRDLLDFSGSGMSILEMSHRSAAYEAVHNQAIADLKTLLNCPDDYAILFMGGGAQTQFALVAMNLLVPGTHADYLVTGQWSKSALREAQKIGDARASWSGAASQYSRIPLRHDYDIDPAASYLHYTSNNTITGTQFSLVPESGDVPLVCDMSSDILSQPLDVSQFGLIYAGAQKNAGPAGVTLVIIRRDLLARSPASLPSTLSYAEMDAKNSLLNTPPVFAIYMTGLVARYLIDTGGLSAAAERNADKATQLYAALDASDGFYQGCVHLHSRSLMNVTFRLPTQELEAQFVSESEAAGFAGLKGHRSVGGIRVSLYNAVTIESVQALVDFMEEFQQRWK
ncbi:3-phosphoserine/phosphohydroxythreonine transaminase [Candidatus Entotheonella palauensis]|uniref:Phosphoserine aminotransferase n=1 Tax=Candidatus Entotheonella gemina TaxID=1429439 RepID=W4LIY9_9BACT|nr:3-phosphoserine/phosphohydroxythreonine transaminase [Candidatus Entotheonella palauensis]ETW97864.1 MAG: MFS transporter [Candidatus Entotheonella gemina]